MYRPMPFRFLTGLLVFAPLQEAPDQSVPLRERSTLRCPVEDLPVVSLTIPDGEVSQAAARSGTLARPEIGKGELTRFLSEGPTAKRLGELAKKIGAEAVVDVRVGEQTVAATSQQYRIRYSVSGIPVKRRSPECKPL